MTAATGAPRNCCKNSGPAVRFPRAVASEQPPLRDASKLAPGFRKAISHDDANRLVRFGELLLAQRFACRLFFGPEPGKRIVDHPVHLLAVERNKLIEVGPHIVPLAL